MAPKKMTMEENMAALVEAEQACIQRFCSNVPFPTHEQVCEILCSQRDIDLLAEYGPMNHDFLKELYETNFADTDLIKENGRHIRRICGERTLVSNQYALNRIMVHLTRTADPRLLDMIEVRSPCQTFVDKIDPASVLCFINKSHLVPQWWEFP